MKTKRHILLFPVLFFTLSAMSQTISNSAKVPNNEIVTPTTPEASVKTEEVISNGRTAVISTTPNTNNTPNEQTNTENKEVLIDSRKRPE